MGISFSVFSDLHILEWAKQPNYGYDKLAHALEFHQNKLPKSDAFLFLGDITYQLDSDAKPICEALHPQAYDHVTELIERYIPDTPCIFTLGNHEFPQGNLDPELTRAARALWQEKFGQPFHYKTKIGGYHFIAGDVLDYTIPVNPECEAFLMKAADEAIAEDPTKPVFMIMHAPLATESPMQTKMCYTDAFRDYLYAHPQIVFLSGHTHIVLQDENAIMQNGYTSVNVAQMAIGGSAYSALPDSVSEITQSLYVEVEDSTVRIHRYDLVREKEIGMPWILNIKDYVQRKHIPQPYTAMRAITAPRPTFSATATADATVSNGKIEIRFAQDFIPSPYYVTQYRVVAYEKSTMRPLYEHTFPSDAWFTDMKKWATYTISDLSPDRLYLFAIHPCNSFSVTGDPITCELN